MENCTYIILKKNNINGEFEIMDTKNIVKEIVDIYKVLNIPIKSNKNINNYEKVSKYDYNQKSSLDINTYAKI